MAIDPDSIRPEEFMEPGSDDEDDDYDPNEDLGKQFDLFGDGKLVKTVTACGEGVGTPGAQAEARIHYTGTLEDGTEFATSRSSDAPVTVHLGQGQAIRGLEEAIRTMKKGEKATLRCASEYGYGDQGKPPTVPPNAVLLFELELVSWTEWKDISEAKDGSLMKKTTDEGEGWRHPDFDSAVVVSWTVKVRDSGAVVSTVERGKFTIGAEEIQPKGLEKTLQTMLAGEKALVLLSPSEGFGTVGHSELSVPPDAELLCSVELHEFQAVLQPWEVEGHEAKLARALQLKEEGNVLFKAGHLTRAVKKYQFALSFVESEFAITGAQKAERRPVRVSIHLNLAACGVKSGVWDSVVEHCTQALDLDPENAKALLRRGRAYSELGMWREGRLDLQAVLDGKAVAEKAEAQKELVKLNRLAKMQDNKEKHAFQGMFRTTNDAPQCQET